MRTVLVSPIVARSKFHATIGLVCVFLTTRLHGSNDATLKGILPISFLAPYGFTGPLTSTHVRLLGLCFKTSRMGTWQLTAMLGSLETRGPREELSFLFNNLPTLALAAACPHIWSDFLKIGVFWKIRLFLPMRQAMGIPGACPPQPSISHISNP